DRRGVPGDLPRDELEAASGGVGDHEAPHSRAEHTALGLDVERPFVVGNAGRLDATDLRGVLAQLLTLCAHAHRRGEIELVVHAPFALLDVNGGRLTGDVVHPAEALGENGAVCLY